MENSLSGQKLYISANQLLNDSFELGFRVLDSTFEPDILLALWRGGTPVGIAIEELLSLKGLSHLHFPVKTSHYSGINCREENIEISGLEPVFSAITGKKRILIVDDVFDTGLTIDRVINKLNELSQHTLEIKVATPYFKPANNLTARKPDYYLYTSDKWIVFPHELDSLSNKELLEGKPELPILKSREL